MVSSKHGSASEWWHALADALAEARETAAGRAQEVGGRARDRFDEAGGEAQYRAARAWEALAGRPEPRPWLPLFAAAMVGVVIGWAGAEVFRSRRPQIEQALTAAGEQMREAKTAVNERIEKVKATPGGPAEKAKAAFTGDDEKGPATPA